MRITLDTNILIRAHGNAKGVARRLLQVIQRSKHVLVLSQSILYELEEVLSYPRVRKLTGLSDSEVTEYIAELANLATIVDLGEPTTISAARC